MTGSQSHSSSAFAAIWLLRLNFAISLLLVGAIGVIYFWDDLPNSITNKFGEFGTSENPITDWEEIEDVDEIEMKRNLVNLENLKHRVSWSEPWYQLSAVYAKEILAANDYVDIQIANIQWETGSRTANVVAVCNKRKGTKLVPINFQTDFSWVNDLGWCYFPSESEGGELVYYYKKLNIDKEIDRERGSSSTLPLFGIIKSTHKVRQKFKEVSLNPSEQGRVEREE